MNFLNLNILIRSITQTQCIILACSTLLLGIWSLPETIALRNITLFGGALASIFFLYHNKAEFLSFRAWPIYVFFGFFPWLIIHLLFLSNEFNEQFSELLSLWLRSSLAGLIGLATGLILKNNYIESKKEDLKHITQGLPTRNSENVNLILLYAGLSGFAFISLGYLIFQWFYLGQTPQFTPDMNSNLLYKLYKAKIPFIIGGAFFFPLCFILIIRSINCHKSFFWATLGLLGIACGFFVVIFSNTRNGVIIYVFALIIFIFNLAFKFKWSNQRSRFGILIIGFIICLSFFGITKHLEKNPSWTNLLANIEIGIDIDGEKFWRDREAYSSPPLNRYRVPVDDSTYDRVAWFSVGAQLLSENPLGFGLVRHSFGRLALSKWPDFYKPTMHFRGATHSGWLDLALGVGMPGLLLIWVPLFISWYRSLRLQGLWFSYTTWSIPVMGLAYLISEANGEHFVELLFFFVAFFCGITTNASSKILEVQ